MDNLVNSFLEKTCTEMGGEVCGEGYVSECTVLVLIV